MSIKNPLNFLFVKQTRRGLWTSWAPTVMKSHDDPFLKPARDKKHEKEKGKSYLKKEEHKKLETRMGEEVEEKDREILLPSWIPGLSGAAFEMEEHPAAGLRMERRNADTLVGLPDESGRRTYTAAGDKELDLDKLEFRKWPTLKKPGSTYPEYSMFVRGFVLDEVATVEHLAANGNIPYRWLPAGGWDDTDTNPPDEFWRTLVADRAQNSHNPPTYFPGACKESMRYKAKTMLKTGGCVDCGKLIEEGGCTIVAQFSAKGSGVRDDVSSGFQVCILYGCSVPVVLQKIKKQPPELKAELIDRYDQWYKQFYSKVGTVVAFCGYRYRKRRDNTREGEAGPSNMAAHRQRRGKGTWPLNQEELAESKKLAAPRKSSLKVIPEGSPVADADGAGSSKAEVPKKVLLSTETAKFTEEVPPPHVEKTANEVASLDEAIDPTTSRRTVTPTPNTQPLNLSFPQGIPASPQTPDKSGAGKEEFSVDAESPGC
ncbi:hypothetical protein BGZ57DRAFT_962210 [Hyaloscypha finlandica]|nr:hypothetical protein BGZ57DRAFT_962210 [Hyaloscypha finlandica]